MFPSDDRSFVRHEQGLFDPAVMRRVRAHYDAIEAERLARIADQVDAERVEVGAATKALRFDPMWHEPWVHAPADVADRLRPFTWLTFPIQLRHITENSHLVPWHQDIAYALRMPRQHRQLITCFTPLEPNPAEVSGLAFALGSFDLLEHVARPGHGACIENIEFENVVTFDLALGDCMAFGDHSPHVTTPGKDGKFNRRSFEYRLIMPQDALPDKDYFDIERRVFIRNGEIVDFPENPQ